MLPFLIAVSLTMHQQFVLKYNYTFDRNYHAKCFFFIFSPQAARHSEDGSQEYLCKWRGLPYSECTWEDGNLISNWYLEEIDSYLERNASDRIPNKNARVLRHRPKFYMMKEQLRGLGGRGRLQLRDYQLEGVNWLVKSWCK